MVKISYWKIFRLIFVVFSLYLMGDAFYRWDGFKLYASLPEFLLSVALAYVMLTILAIAAAFLIWAPCICLEWLSLRTGLKRQKELLSLFTALFALVAASLWTAKRSLFPLISTTLQSKYIFLFCGLAVSVFASYLLRDRYRQLADQVKRFFDAVQVRITPLVWVFGVFVLLASPVVVYQTWFAGIERSVNAEGSLPPASKAESPNIVLVTFDAMSAQNMSLYGYERPTTPFIDELAETATVFSRVEAESNFTAPTTSSLITGKRVWSHLRFSRMRGSPPIKADTESLPVVLKKNGYYNIAFMVNMLTQIGNLGVSGSFDVSPFPTEFMASRNIVRMIHKTLTPIFYGKFKIHNWFFQEGFITESFLQRVEEDFTVTAYPPELAFNKLISAIDQSNKPYFAWIHLNPPHAPYLPPDPYKGMFDDSGNMLTFKTQLNERNDLLKYRSVNNRFPDEIETLRARYDEFVRYCDSQFEKFIEQMEKEGRLKNTVVILSTDHGEIFDHNNILHGNTLYEPETHIPLLIKEPGQSKGRIVDDLAEQIDIPATILALAGIDVPSWMEGRSLVPLMRGEGLPAKPAFAMNLEKNESRKQIIDKGSIAVWDGDYKLIHNLENEVSELYNLKHDPGETIDLIDAEPEMARYLLGQIHKNLGKANERIISAN